MSGALHLVRTVVDRVALTTFAAETGLLDDDLGYALHLALRRRFGSAAPQPFRRIEAARDTTDTLLGYVADPAPLLAALPASPDLPDPLGDWGPTPGDARARTIFPRPFEARPMPGAANWQPGHRFAFEVMVRPVRRYGGRLRELRAGRRRDDLVDGACDTMLAAGERDAFLCAVATLDKGTHDRTRGAVYADWLAERFGGAATIERCALTRFRRARVVRSAAPGSAAPSSASGGRAFAGGRGRAVEGPEAVMDGLLTVREPAAFGGLLARGAGRHVAFGYGMLLLRPVR